MRSANINQDCIIIMHATCLLQFITHFFFSNAFLLFFHFQLKEEKNFTFITKIGIMYNMLVESINQRLASSIAENKFIY
jgi:hypothetical protein